MKSTSEEQKEEIADEDEILHSVSDSRTMVPGLSQSVTPSWEETGCTMHAYCTRCAAPA